MSLNGKTDNFTKDDLFEFGAYADLKRHEVKRILDQIYEAKSKWGAFCDVAGVEPEMARRVELGFRTVAS